MAAELFASSDPYGAPIGKAARSNSGLGGGSSSSAAGGGGGAASPDRKLWLLALHAPGPQDPPAATDSAKLAAAAASFGAGGAYGSGRLPCACHCCSCLPDLPPTHPCTPSTSISPSPPFPCRRGVRGLCAQGRPRPRLSRRRAARPAAAVRRGRGTALHAAGGAGARHRRHLQVRAARAGSGWGSRVAARPSSVRVGTPTPNLMLAPPYLIPAPTLPTQPPSPHPQGGAHQARPRGSAGRGRPRPRARAARAAAHQGGGAHRGRSLAEEEYAPAC
jgi:hypothetical protein